LLGSFQSNIFLTFTIAFSIILSAGYSIWLLNRISFGSLKLTYFTLFQDVSRREFYILLPLLFLILWMGLLPNNFLNEIHFTVSSLLEHCSNS
jgi:NADH:ubiquinone oxidoreductase subunit 4 (subunit M)